MTFWCGDDNMYLPSLALGGYGSSRSRATCADASCARWPTRSTPATSPARAASTATSFALMTGLFTITSPIPVKWAMGTYGFDVGPCRSPLGAMPDSLKATLEPLIAPYRP